MYQSMDTKHITSSRGKGAKGKNTIETRTVKKKGNKWVDEDGKMYELVEERVKKVKKKRHMTDVKSRAVDFLLKKCPQLREIFDILEPMIGRFPTMDAITKVTDTVKRVKKGKKGGKVLERLMKKATFNNNHYFQDFENFEYCYKLVKGYMQMGKTKFIIAASVWYILQGKSSVIVTRNVTRDGTQTTARTDYFIKELANYLGDMTDQLNIQVVSGNNVIKKFDGAPKIMVVIANETRLKPLVEKFRELKEVNGEKKFGLFIDEVDFVDSLDTKVNKQINFLKSMSITTYGISATVMDPALKDNIDKGNVIFLQAPQYYKGVDSFQMVHLEHDHYYVSTRDGDVFEADPNLKWYLRRFNKQSPIYVDMYEEYHPRDGLIRVAYCNDPNLRLLHYISVAHPSIPVMFFEGKGVTLHLQGQNTPFTLSDGTTSKIIKTLPAKGLNGESLNGSFHFFKNSSTPYVKEWLKKNGGVEKFPRILTIAGPMASRCQSYGSADFADCVTAGKLAWHLTEAYMTMTRKNGKASLDQPEIMQTAGRLCVVAHDNIQLLFFSTKATCQILVKSYWSQEELIKRALECQQGKYIKKIIEAMPFSSDKICKEVSMTKKTSYTLNKVSEKEDALAGGWDQKVCYNTFKPNGDILKPRRMKKKKVKKKAVEENNESKEVVESMKELGDEFYRLTNKMFIKWSTVDSKISRFMDSLDPKKLYTKEEMRRLCKEHKVEVSALHKAKFASGSNGYGIILQKINGGYRLHPCLIEKFDEFFSG